MILVFGGTTEGRKAVKALEEAGSLYYYSTKGTEQEVVLHHGIRVTGAMDEPSMISFCQSHDIRLIIDAAHPFAEVLHATVAKVASSLQLPAIRFERLFYPHTDPSIMWCADFDEAISRIEAKRLLATTGVKSIAKLKLLEQKGTEVFYRILDRKESLDIADMQHVDRSHLCFYDSNEDEHDAFRRIKPDAILVKESGESGGFAKKVEAAKDLGIRVYAIRRPQISDVFQCVNGEFGLRRMVEKLLPDFYPLHSGLTTGTCATAAAIAATLQYLKNERPEEVMVTLPNGESIPVQVEYGSDYAFVVKDSGDDPDVTKGLEICAKVCRTKVQGITIRGGKGIGTITLPGFDFPPGEPAINKVPRMMLRQNLSAFGENLEVTIFVPEGEEIAKRTFNPRLGIVGGISIVGVSGIIMPFSEEGFINSIRKCMEVAKATGFDRVVINSGAKSESFIRNYYPDLPPQLFVEYGNFIGETIKLAHEVGIHTVCLGIMLGKAVKLAEGHLDTHSKKVVMNKPFIAEMAREAGCSASTIEQIQQITLARELWKIIPPETINAFCKVVISHCKKHCDPLLPNGHLIVLLIDENGKVYSVD